MANILVTGGAGFFGGLLVDALLARGYSCVSVDLEPDGRAHPRFRAIRGDIRDAALMDAIFAEGRFDAVFHCAAQLAHAVRSRELLWTSNVDGTRVVAECAKKHGVQRLIFTSSNCLWGHDLGHPVGEEEPPRPVEIYGRSKWEAEKILREYENDLHVVIFRCCTIVERGRLGLLAILFAFIEEGRKVWVVNGGNNVYQFIDAHDLIDACVRSLAYDRSDLFHIGSDHVRSFRDVYEYVIRRAGTGARVASLPGWLILPLMRAAYRLGLSPLGPYQYKMIASNFLFDTTKIKNRLGWKPAVTNEEMLWNAYEYYREHRGEMENLSNVSAHKQPAKMGIIRLLKWMS